MAEFTENECRHIAGNSINSRLPLSKVESLFPIVSLSIIRQITGIAVRVMTLANRRERVPRITLECCDQILYGDRSPFPSATGKSLRE